MLIGRRRWNLIPATGIAAVVVAVAWIGGSAAFAAEGAWRLAAPMPTPRSEIAAAVLDGKIYVAGGIGPFGISSVLEIYDPGTNRWKRGRSMPEPRHHTAMAAAAGRIYVSGGYEGRGRARHNHKTIWGYDPAADRWSKLPDMPAVRAAHRMGVIGRNLYVVGGVGPRPRTVMVYDTKTRQWDTSLPPLPSRREHLAVSVLNGHLVVIAGRWRREGNFSVVEALNVKSKEWLRLPDLPARRGGFSGATVGGRIHVTGGEALGSFTTYAEHWAYDPAQNKWELYTKVTSWRRGG